MLVALGASALLVGLLGVAVLLYLSDIRGLLVDVNAHLQDLITKTDLR